MRKLKQKTWRQYVSELQFDVPQVQIYRKIRQIKGKASKRTSIVQENGLYYSTPNKISNKLASTFAEVSSISNWSEVFRLYKRNSRCESQPHKIHLQTQLQDGSRLIFSYICFSSCTFPGAPYRILPDFLVIFILSSNKKTTIKRLRRFQCIL